MFRRFRRIAISAAVLFLLSSDVSAQMPWYGYWGGSTVAGDVDRGLGLYFMGLGQYNYDTALAFSIYRDTLIRENDYYYSSSLLHNRHYWDRVAREKKRTTDAQSASLGRLTDQPGEADVARGSALNVLLRRLADQTIISPSSLRLAKIAVPGGTVEKAPLLFAPAGVVISAGRLAEPVRWPLVLRGAAFEPARLEYDRAVDRALDDVSKGALQGKAVEDVELAIGQLGRGLKELGNEANPADVREAVDFLRRLSQAAQPLRSVKAERVLADLLSYGGTTVDDLVQFLTRSDLQFGPAETPEERDLYRSLHRLLAQQWDAFKAKSDANP